MQMIDNVSDVPPRCKAKNLCTLNWHSTLAPGPHEDAVVVASAYHSDLLEVSIFAGATDAWQQNHDRPLILLAR